VEGVTNAVVGGVLLQKQGIGDETSLVLRV